MAIFTPKRISSFLDSNPYPNTGTYDLFKRITHLNFTDLGELRANWHLFMFRDSFKYGVIENALNQYPPEFMNGYGYYNIDGPDALAFLLLSDWTADCVHCCRRIISPSDHTRYIEPEHPCGNNKFCLRCSFHDAQAFVKKMKSYFHKNKDYFWVTITDPEIFHVSSIGLTQELFDGFKGKIKLVRDRLLKVQRRKNSWIEGMIFAEEVACINLLDNNWNSHIHLLIQSPKQTEPDLCEFVVEGFLCDYRRIVTPTEFTNKLRYLKKPLSNTIRERYRIEFKREHALRLYRNADQGIEVLRELFQDNHRCEKTGCFRNKAKLPSCP